MIKLRHANPPNPVHAAVFAQADLACDSQIENPHAGPPGDRHLRCCACSVRAAEPGGLLCFIGVIALPLAADVCPFIGTAKTRRAALRPMATIAIRYQGPAGGLPYSPLRGGTRARHYCLQHAPQRGSCALPRMRLAGWAASNVHDYDEILARLLITSWTLATGRTLRGDVRPQMLSAEELISFWADEQMTADHAPGPPATYPRAASRSRRPAPWPDHAS